MPGTDSEIVSLYLVSTAIILFLVVLVAVFMVAYQRRVMAQKTRILHVEAESQKQVMAAIVETQESERIRIARDLHDEVGALLSSVKMGIKLSERKLANAPGEPPVFSELTGMLDTAIESVRGISHDLLPPSLEALGLAKALEAMANHLSRTSGIPFLPAINGLAWRLPIRTELTLYRVVQEMSNNSLKHSGATQRTLHVFFSPQMLRITFQDNGKGFDYAHLKASAKGLGLRGMESRVESVGGTLEVKSEEGGGYWGEIRIGAAKEIA